MVRDGVKPDTGLIMKSKRYTANAFWVYARSMNFQNFKYSWVNFCFDET